MNERSGCLKQHKFTQPSPSSKKTDKSQELVADLIDLSSPGNTDGGSSVSYSRSDSVHSSINHAETHHHHSIKEDISPAATDDKDMNFNSVDTWIDQLDAETDTSYFPNIHYDTNFTTKLATMQNLPRIKISNFNGSALDWLNFVVEFREVIHEQPYINGSQRMSYLIQSLSGDAKRSVMGLSHDWKGYVCGLKRLKLLFGQRATIVHAHMEHIMQLHVKDSDTETLSVFYYSLNDCVMSLQRLNFNSDIYSTHLLGLLVQRLPIRLRRKWSEYAWKIRCSAEPSILHLQV